MKKVITYGTFDMLHYGHVSLLKRAKELGDYLIVGVTTENFDLNRGKLNIRNSLMERIQAVIDTGYADEVIPEEYEGQKIDDIIKYDIDIFAIGSDWEGHFDYLKEYCQVVYLERTKGISSTQIRKTQQLVNMGVIGSDSYVIEKFIEESKYVSGLNIVAIFVEDEKNIESLYNTGVNLVTSDIVKFFEFIDAVYIYSSPIMRFEYAQQAIQCKKHVLCTSPIALKAEQSILLYDLAKSENVVLCEAIKTAYFCGFLRLILLIKSGVIGEVKSIDVTCTSLDSNNEWDENKELRGGSMTCWAPFALLAVFKILGVDYKKCIFTTYVDDVNGVDLFTKLDLLYNTAVANVKVGIGVKSEGDLIVSGTKAYIYIPSPWWKTEYFEIRYENFSNNRRCFYQLQGEGIRYELAEFLKYTAFPANAHLNVSQDISQAITKIMEEFFSENTNSKHLI